MNSQLLKEMGVRLSKRRKQLKLTQEELAEKADVTSQMISSAELGQKALRPENIIKLCFALEISTDYLLQGIISEYDISLLNEKLSSLNPQQYRFLENIIDNFILALKLK